MRDARRYSTASSAGADALIRPVPYHVSDPGHDRGPAQFLEQLDARETSFSPGHLPRWDVQSFNEDGYIGALRRQLLAFDLQPPRGDIAHGRGREVPAAFQEEAAPNLH